MKSFSAKVTNVSFEPALNVTTPEALVVPTNCLRTVYCVSVAPALSVVRSVLITCFGNLNRALFFCVSLSRATLLVSNSITSVP